MRIDGAVNYSSFMQHYNPLDVRPNPSPSSQQASESQGSVSGVSKTSAVQSTAKSEGTVSKIGESSSVVSGRSPYKNTAVQDIEVDFSGNDSRFEFGGFQLNETSDMQSMSAKDPLLQDYLYFVDTPTQEKLVDDNDGTVLKLG